VASPLWLEILSRRVLQWAWEAPVCPDGLDLVGQCNKPDSLSQASLAAHLVADGVTRLQSALSKLVFFSLGFYGII
jgi:hypothetical protein